MPSGFTQNEIRPILQNSLTVQQGILNAINALQAATVTTETAIAAAIGSLSGGVGGKSTDQEYADAYLKSHEISKIEPDDIGSPDWDAWVKALGAASAALKENGVELDKEIKKYKEAQQQLKNFNEGISASTKIFVAGSGAITGLLSKADPTAFTRLGVELNILFLHIGRSFIPLLRSAITTVQELSAWFANLSDNSRAFISISTEIVLAIVGIAFTFNILHRTLLAIQTAAIGASVAMKTLWAAIIAHPLVALITAAAATAVAAGATTEQVIGGISGPIGVALYKGGDTTERAVGGISGPIGVALYKLFGGGKTKAQSDNYKPESPILKPNLLAIESVWSKIQQGAFEDPTKKYQLELIKWGVGYAKRIAEGVEYQINKRNPAVADQ